ncbi:helix-turn-helix domain-containing protein [Kitasatospora sp. NPDC059463]|uniref:helix-turn-helix domain-containing protein n=1 Tax=unclassified Kitasatospora TaxID=2633591 RepID=UPI0036B357F3
MRAVRSAYDVVAVWEIATPSGAGPVPGVGMAGFRARAADPVDLGVVPFPAVTLALDLGEAPLAVDDASGGRERGSVLVGLDPGPVRGRGSGVDCLQVRLSPPAAHAVLGGAAAEAGGSVVPLDALWGRDAARVLERLRTAGSWECRFAIAQAELARRCAESRRVDPEVAEVWRRMVTEHGGARVERMAAEVGWSRKRLWSRFRSQVGVTPKRAAQLVRFDHVAHRLAAGHGVARIAAECGYADQSHLHRDVAAFTGATPAALAGAPWLAVDEIAWPRRAACR